jgi:peptidylprolyl isomerase
MKNAIVTLSLLTAALPLAAQTAAPASHATPANHAAHVTAATPAHHTIPGACLTLPPISPKVPALPADAPCPKALYTITRTPDTRAEYISPLVSPELRESLNTASTTYTLAYIDTVKGTGEVAKPGKFVSVKYTGYLTDGTKFDSSEDHPNKEPISFPYGTHRVIQGWDTGFEGLHVGGKRRLLIPYQLAYGETGHGPIPAKSALVFDVELVSVSDTEPKRTPPPPPAVKQTNPPATQVPPPSAANAPAKAGATPAPASTEPKK